MKSFYQRAAIALIANSLLLAGDVFAQAAAKQSNPGKAANSANTPSQSSGNRNTLIEEVFVTVTKRTESVQKVSAAVSAYTGELLKANNIQDFQSLSDLTPGMTTRSEGSISIRGISNSVSGGASPVAFHVNGMFLDERGAPFYDIESLEVLRGPSGTAFGRNATGGAINVKWRRPDPEWGVGGDFRKGSLSEEQLRAYINVPFFGEDDPRLLGRFVFYKRQRNGTIDNYFEKSENDAGAIDSQFFRFTLSSEPMENMLLRVRGIYSERNDDILDSASMSLETRATEYSERLRTNYDPERGNPPLSKDNLLEIQSDLKLRYPDFPAHEGAKHRLDGDLNWGLQGLPLLGDVDLDVLYMEQRARAKGFLDLDGTDVPVVDIRSWNPKDTRKNAEIRLTSQYNDGFNWQAGAFWYRQTTKRLLWTDARLFAGAGDVFAASPFGNPVPVELPPTIGGQSTGGPDSVTEVDSIFFGERNLKASEAIFGNVKLNLKEMFDWPDIEIVVGARKNKDVDRLTVDYELVQIVALAGTRLNEPFPLVQNYDVLTFGEFEATTGEFGAKWFYSDLGMIYAKIAKGYKAGKAERVQRINNPVDPEFLNSFEFGWKVGFFQRAILLNFSTYIYDYTDLQITKITDNGFFTENAGEADIRGAELEIQFSPSANLYGQFAVSYNDNEFGQFCGNDNELENQDVQPGCDDPAQPHNFKGEGVADAPKWTVAGLIRYSFQLGDWGTLTPQVKMNWVDDYFRRPYGNPIDDIDGYTKTDLRLIWQSPQEKYRVEAFIENLEDHDDLFYAHFSLPDPGAYSLLSVQPPRTSGIIFEASL